MKRKGISLIVLIITIVVIIILAASIILNMSKINIINNANTAVLKQDIATLQSELDLYKADRFVDERGKYDAIKLSADTSKATYGDERIEDKNNDGNSNIHDILTSLKKSRYKDNVYIQDGKLVFKKSGLKDEEIEIILEMGLQVDGMPKVESIENNNTYTSIEVALDVSLAEEVEKVIYILNDGKREESTELTRTFTGLTPGVNYTLEVILVLKDGTEISKKEIISTKSIGGELTYTPSETDWTNKDVTVTIEYSEETMPEGYVLQYKTKDVNGNVVQDWIEYTEPVVVTENNTTVVGRLYNGTLEDEKIPSDKTITIIDKDVPTAPTELTLTVDGSTITATASGSTDAGSGIDKYMYSIDNITWQESNEFGDLKSETEYTVYAKSIDAAGNESTIIEEKATIAKVYEIVFNNVNGTKNTTIDGKDFAYNNPVVPVGFMAVNTNDAKWTEENGWNNGLVIADAKGNEFVWVPCTIDGKDGTIIYKKNYSYPSEYSARETNTIEYELPDGVESEQYQIEKYEGFYIGRYEAGKENNTIVSKGNVNVYTDIAYNNIRNLILNKYTDEYVKSGVFTEKQWDTICSWMEKSGINVTTDYTWGNYSGTKAKTGSNENWKNKNIYDFAGNIWEWTNSRSGISESYTYFRGGSYITKTGYPASYCAYRSENNLTYPNLGTRFVLYVN